MSGEYLEEAKVLVIGRECLDDARKVDDGSVADSRFFRYVGQRRDLQLPPRQPFDVELERVTDDVEREAALRLAQCIVASARFQSEVRLKLSRTAVDELETVERPRPELLERRRSKRARRCAKALDRGQRRSFSERGDYLEYAEDESGSRSGLAAAKLADDDGTELQVVVSGRVAVQRNGARQFAPSRVRVGIRRLQDRSAGDEILKRDTARSV